MTALRKLPTQSPNTVQKNSHHSVSRVDNVASQCFEVTYERGDDGFRCRRTGGYTGDVLAINH